MEVTKKQRAKFLGENYQTIVNADRQNLSERNPEGRYATYLSLVSEEDLAAGGLVKVYFTAKDLFKGSEVEAIGTKPKHIRSHEGLAIAVLYPQDTGPISPMDIKGVPFEETAHRVLWSSSDQMPIADLVIPAIK